MMKKECVWRGFQGLERGTVVGGVEEVRENHQGRKTMTVYVFDQVLHLPTKGSTFLLMVTTPRVFFTQRQSGAANEEYR